MLLFNNLDVFFLVFFQFSLNFFLHCELNKLLHIKHEIENLISLVICVICYNKTKNDEHQNV